MCCKHVLAAAIARAKREQPHACLDSWVYLTVEEDGQEFEITTCCRRCGEEA